MKKTLSIILAIVTLLCVVPYASASVKTFQVNTASGGTLPTSLVSYWNLNGPTGNATDYYGSNNLTNTGSVGYSAGLVGDAGNFTTGEYFKGTSGMLSYAQSQAFSINCWVQRSATSAYMTIFGNSDSNVVGYWFAFQSNNSLGFYIVDSAANYISRDSAAGGNTTTSYQMVTATYSGSGTQAGMNIYVNGTNVNSVGNAGSMNGTITSTASPAIGATWNGSSYVYPMMGQIDECGFWKKVLSANEMTDLYNGGAGQTMVWGDTQSDSMMNADSRFATVAFTKRFVAALAATIMNAASRFTTLAGNLLILVRNVSVTMMNAASRLTMLAGTITKYVTALSVSMMNSASRLATLFGQQMQYIANLSVSMMNAVSRLVVLTTGNMKILVVNMMNAAGRFTTIYSQVSLYIRNLTVNMMYAVNRLTSFLVTIPGTWAFRAKNLTSWAFRAKNLTSWAFRTKNPPGAENIPSEPN